MEGFVLTKNEKNSTIDASEYVHILQSIVWFRMN